MEKKEIIIEIEHLIFTLKKLKLPIKSYVTVYHIGIITGLEYVLKKMKE